MARTEIPYHSYEGPNAKIRLSPGELKALSTSGLKTEEEVQDNEREAEEAAKAQKCWLAEKRQLTKDVLSERQYSVYKLDAAGLKSSKIAKTLGISVGAVYTFRYEYTQALRSGQPYSQLKKGG
jgi:DNA-binding NarL/FixJ family response regulator